jgi:hypothetical protein
MTVQPFRIEVPQLVLDDLHEPLASQLYLTGSLIGLRDLAESAFGTTRTFRNVRYSVAVGCKAGIEQAASKMLDLRVHVLVQ